MKRTFTRYKFNKYSICTIGLILLVFLYQLPIAVIIPKGIRQIGLFAALACVLLTLFIHKSLKMIVLALLSGLISVCLYYTCWSIYPNYADTGSLVSKTIQYFLFWGYLFFGSIYQKAHQRQKKKVFVFWLLITIITMTTTLLGEIRFPGVARLLAGIATEEESDFYKQYNIGSYNTVYGVLMALPVWCYLFKTSKKSQKILSAFMIVYSLIFFIITEYAFAVIGAVVIMLWYLFLSDNWNVWQFMKFSAALLVFVLLLFSIEPILDYFIKYTISHDMGSFNRRLVAIKQLLQTGVQSDDIYKRNLHYNTSITAFMQHPVLGGIIDLKNLKLGRHSELFDLMASLGLWGVFYLGYTLLYYYKKAIKPYKKDLCYRYMLIGVLCFLYLLVVNLVLNFHNVSFGLFVLPILVFPYKRNKYDEITEIIWR